MATFLLPGVGARLGRLWPQSVIEPLAALAWDGTDTQKEKAAGALWSLASNDDNQVAIRRQSSDSPPE